MVRVPLSGPVRTLLPTGRDRLLRAAVACVVALGLAAYLAVSGIFGNGDGGRCTVRAADGGGSYSLAAEAAANAATIAAVASRRGLPERAVTIALATAMQESGLRNITHGDRDSVGLFQQRPSQGWGTGQQIQDPVYSAGKFYDYLVKVPGYSRLPLTAAAQRVQRSGFPQAYAKHEADATLLTAALTGRNAAALTCTTGRGDGKDEPGDPERVRAQLVREFGKDVFAPRRDDEELTPSAPTPTVTPAAVPADGTADEADGAETRAAAHGGASAQAAHPSLTVPAHERRRGWVLAHWAVANATDLRIERVTFQGRVWSADRAGDGWRVTGGARSGERSTERDVALRLASGR
ncbi:heavy metal transporter [Streptomyces sp. NPDC048172]|uniref:heavy metal transporter n=1 Tax=Streptomyces sp. NPDC048172 TaxID=3365505 RepID=UPI00371001B7